MHIRTPLIESPSLSRLNGAEVWLKMESAQPVGSFKLRGIGHVCEHHVRNGATGLVSSSGGNAGLAVAYSGKTLGVPVTVVVPRTTKVRARDLISQQSADVVVHGADWSEAHAHAQTLARDGRVLIHPFDDPLLWEGHATLIDEVAQEWRGDAPDLIVLSVGGGGLLCGVIRGLERNAWISTRVLAVETQGAASFAAALKAGRPVMIDSITSIATSLGARQVAAAAVEYAKKYSIHSCVVSDGSALNACEQFLDDHRTLVEPACGASLAPLYEAHEAISGYKRVLVVVCGGVGVTAAQLRLWSDQLIC